MTGSVQLAFANNQSVPLPNDTASHTVDLSDTIDQGVPQVPVHGTTALSQDIGNGGLVPINASVVFPSSAGAATYRFQLLTSTDNATWVTLSERIYTDSTGAGGQRIPAGVKRYLKMQIVFSCGSAPGANKTAIVNGSLGDEVSTIV